LRRATQAHLAQRVLFLCSRAGHFSVFAFMLPLSASFVVRLGSLLGVLSASVAVRASQQIVFALYSYFATLDADKLFSKLKCHELSSKSSNYDTSHIIKSFITSACIDGHDANSTNVTVSSALQFVLFSLVTASDEQYESISNDEITLLPRKFRVLHMFHKKRSRPTRGCLECGNIIHFITDYPKRKKFDSYNKYDYTK
jgi:hypothetical protein